MTTATLTETFEEETSKHRRRGLNHAAFLFSSWVNSFFLCRGNVCGSDMNIGIYVCRCTPSRPINIPCFCFKHIYSLNLDLSNRSLIKFKRSTSVPRSRWLHGGFHRCRAASGTVGCPDQSVLSKALGASAAERSEKKSALRLSEA